ncbi:TPA: Rha family transcriptional regulator, partial [Klebsiella pneumoniae]|nr:Rha family transcriptional regulator [Klebsiella pneumoniae]HBW5597861.1 Rha family transcriptional regulator [Klebsiella pneumoniae]HBZ9376279.1 Rha family transcriptional regulator [Klebsiella pneumoniae]HBZ9415577.1 Rha family transcriptional regulator [Klebsiella pneumoniae]HBZ9844769.1 Rha family transcriptional regulator [Klebsiella pneumoniae]
MNNLNTLTRRGDSYPEAGTIPTMSSLQMVDYINADRKSKAETEGLAFPCKKYRKLRHDNFMNKVPKVLGEIQSPKFLGD